MQAYSDPKRVDDGYALPDVEVWRDTVSVVSCQCGDYDVPYDSAHVESTPWCPSCGKLAESVEDTKRVAWWWRSCFPGCMPDSDTFGPFATQAEALADAQEGNLDDDPDDEPDDDESED